LDGADTTSSKNSFTTYKHLKMDVKTFACVKLIYIFQGRKAPRNPPAKAKNIRGTAQQLTVTTNPLTDSLNLAMCKFIATVKEAGKKGDTP